MQDFKCWKGQIRTAVPVREQIYSLPVLTTHPPSSKKNRNDFIRNPAGSYVSTSHTIREMGCYINTIKIEYLSLVYTLASPLSRLVILRLLCSVCGMSWNRTSGTWIFSPLLYLLSYHTIVKELFVVWVGLEPTTLTV